MTADSTQRITDGIQTKKRGVTPRFQLTQTYLKLTAYGLKL